MADDYKLRDLRNMPDEDIPTKKVSSSPKVQITKPFIKGPIDLSWLSAVSHLPGKALNVGLALIYLSGLVKSKDDLCLTTKHFKTFNVSRKAASRALNNMEEVGLVKITRAKGRKHRVTII